MVFSTPPNKKSVMRAFAFFYGIFMLLKKTYNYFFNNKIFIVVVAVCPFLNFSKDGIKNKAAIMGEKRNCQ